MVNSRAEAAEAESSRLRNDLIEEMSQTNEAKTQLNEISEQLRTEKMLEIQKDEQIQSVMLKIGDKCEKAMANFQASEAFGIIKHLSMAIAYSDLDFEATDKEMMANERARANEKAGAEGGDEGEGLVDAPVDPPIDPIVDPAIQTLFLFCFTLVYPCFRVGSHPCFDKFV